MYRFEWHFCYILWFSGNGSKKNQKLFYLSTTCRFFEILEWFQCWFKIDGVMVTMWRRCCWNHLEVNWHSAWPSLSPSLTSWLNSSGMSTCGKYSSRLIFKSSSVQPWHSIRSLAILSLHFSPGKHIESDTHSYEHQSHDYHDGKYVSVHFYLMMSWSSWRLWSPWRGKLINCSIQEKMFTCIHNARWWIICNSKWRLTVANSGRVAKRVWIA